MSTLQSLALTVSQLQLLPETELEPFLTERVPAAANATELLQALRADGLLTQYQCDKLAEDQASALMIGPYRLVEPLGAGGMGQVFRAYHPFMNRYVAVKLIRPEQVSSPATLARFGREIRAIAQLEHPNVVRAYDAGQHVDPSGELVLYLAMEVLVGKDLAVLLREQERLSVPAACDLTRQAALGLAYAHARGLVHRDIKPGNLFLTSDGTLKVLDLGLARLGSEIELDADTDADQGISLTKTGAVMGTPDYMAPEQTFDAKLTTPQSDIYSLGCTLYHLLSGKPPYYGHSSLNYKLHAHRNLPPDYPLERIRTDLPDGLTVIVKIMMAKQPEQRFGSMTEVADALASFSQAGFRPRLGPQRIAEPPPETVVWTPPAAAEGPTESTLDDLTRETDSLPSNQDQPHPIFGYSLVQQLRQAEALAAEESAEGKARKVAVLRRIMESAVAAENKQEAFEAAEAILRIDPSNRETRELFDYLRPQLAATQRWQRVLRYISSGLMGMVLGLFVFLPALGVSWASIWFAANYQGWWVTAVAFAGKMLAGGWLFALTFTFLVSASQRRWFRAAGRTVVYASEGIALLSLIGGAATFVLAGWPWIVFFHAVAWFLVILAHLIAPEGLVFEPPVSNSDAKELLAKKNG